MGALALGACGGSKTPTGSGSPTNSSGGGGGGNPVFSAGDCASAARAMAMAAAGGFSGQNNATEDAVATLNRLADAAPSDIRGDVKIMSAALAKFFKAIKDAGIDYSNPSSFSDPAKQQALQQASQDFDASGAKAAGDRISSYFKTICPE